MLSCAKLSSSLAIATLYTVLMVSIKILVVVYNTDIDNSIPNVCALIMVIYQNHHYVCRLGISYLILNKSSGREWLELVEYKWIKIKNLMSH